VPASIVPETGCDREIQRVPVARAVEIEPELRLLGDVAVLIFTKKHVAQLAIYNTGDKLLF
jgi:hypothetical protein